MKTLLLVLLGITYIFAEEVDVLKQFGKENVQFVGQLYKEAVKNRPGNFLICPLSLQTVFALVNLGAKGNTSEQIVSALHLPKNEEQLKKTFVKLKETLQSNDKYTLNTANKVYVKENLKLSENFKNSAVEVFNAEVQNVNFGNAATVKEINKWVELKTQDKIKDLLTEGSIDGSTVAVLINALYFQGKWVKQFGNVITRPFHLNEKDVIDVNMMAVSDDFKYFDSPELGVRFLELPYEGDEVSMTIVLPNEIEGLAKVEENISNYIAEPKYGSQRVNVYLPKFKIETEVHLIPTLSALGIEDAFSPNADFSGIIEDEENMAISDVIQKSLIEVDEKGTTAAAASAVIFARTGRLNELFFAADRPFLFYLKHKTNGVMFIGRYSIGDKVKDEDRRYV